MLLRTLVVCSFLTLGLSLAPLFALEAVPERLVVLTFDDSVKSHYTVVRPILKRYGFGATFFITEGFDFPTNKKDYMTWDEIAGLHADGFEIGNHTRDHFGVRSDKIAELPEQLTAIDRRCEEYGIPRPVTFAYPGNGIAPEGLAVLRDHGIRFARRGGAPEYPYDEGNGFAYEPALDHPLLIPSAGDARPVWTLENFVRAVKQTGRGRIAVLQFHGVPDIAHPWVHSSPAQFESYMKYLADGGYQVIALRDLEKYVDPNVVPNNPQGVIEDRKRALESGSSRDNFRRPGGLGELWYWLGNMTEHAFALGEMCAATGLSDDEITHALHRFRFPERSGASASRLKVLPHPGGRHPRVSFHDGAIRPQRETKASVFLPWAGAGYVVVDIPEAIWVAISGKRHLLYLAHTHIPTYWDKQGIDLEPLEWNRYADGRLECERRLPNGIVFGTRLRPEKDAVRMELWLANGSDQRLGGLRVQNCVMLKDAHAFAAPTNDNKVFSGAYAAVHDKGRKRWVITAWDPGARGWGNTGCPCLHSDPQFPDCAPGETQRVRGWLSFFQGDDIEAEFRRLDESGWRGPGNS